MLQVAKTLHIGSSIISAQARNFFRALVKDVITQRKQTGKTRKDFMQLLIEIKEKGRLAEEHEDDENKQENGINKNNTISMHVHKFCTHVKNFFFSEFTDDDVTAQALLFFMAGFEASSSALTFALFELARHPELQSKARRHIEEVLQCHDGQITYQALQEMTYLDRILQGILSKR
jgi:cytochrome P450 family 6